MRKTLLLLGLIAAAGCGGGDGDSAATPATTAPTPTAIQTVTVPDTANPRATPSGEPTFDVSLTAQAHTAAAGKAWRYTVSATKDGKPTSGTAKMRVFVDDELVDTLGWFPFEGRLTKTHRWPKVLRGKEAVLQAEVEGEGGTQRVNWPVSVS